MTAKKNNRKTAPARSAARFANPPLPDLAQRQAQRAPQTLCMRNPAALQPVEMPGLAARGPSLCWAPERRAEARKCAAGQSPALPPPSQEPACNGRQGCTPAHQAAYDRKDQLIDHWCQQCLLCTSGALKSFKPCASTPQALLFTHCWRCFLQLLAGWSCTVMIIILSCT